jgi:autotransporter-associated beta strand protein
MNTHTRLTAAALLLAAMAALPTQAQTNGTWITAGGGTYSTGTNWQDGTVAGSGGSADFGSVNLPAGAATLTIDAATSLSSLTFGDNDTSTAGTWALAGTGGLTLSGSTPTITTNVNTSLNSGFVITGTSGYVKEGSGQLTFNTAGATNTISGNITLNGGTLAIRGGSTLGSGQITMANGTSFRLENNGSTGAFSGNAIVITTGGNVTLSSSSAGNGYSGLVTGDATSQLNIVNSAGQAFALSSSGTAQLANFLGTVNIASGNSLRFSSTSGPNGNGSANATFNVNGTIFTRNTGGAGGVVLGALTGSGTLTGQTNTLAGDVAYVIGGKNVDASFGGTITNNTNGTASIRKVGTGTQSFTGSMASNGTVRVDAGTLRFAGGFNKTGTGAITVNSGGTLAGSNATLTGIATINSGGVLRPNATPANATDRLTFSTSLVLAAGSSTTFDFDDANFTGITASALTYGGDVIVNFSGTTVAGTYDLYNFTTLNAGSISSISIGGTFTNPTWTNNSGIWSGNNGGFDFVFTESTGDLLISAVPEPSAFALLAGLAGLGCVGLRRRRRA